MQIRASETLTTDPVATLQEQVMWFVDTMPDVNTYTNSNGAQIWSIRYPLADSVCWDYIIQQDGREFQVNTFMEENEDTYLYIVENILDTFAVDPNGDFSGYDEEENDEDEQDFYSMMIDLYDGVLQQVGTALKEQWDIEKLADNNLCTLLANLTADDVQVDFICLENEEVASDYAMVLYTESESIDLLSMYVISGDAFRCVLNSSDRDLYTLL